MWQIYSLAALLFGATEETIDKATMVGSNAIDLLSAAWIRNSISFLISFTVVTVAVGAFPTMTLSVPFVLLGILNGIGAITYTILLKNVEITASSILESFIPLVFLPIDLFIFGAELLPRQIAGILVLILGGCIFFYRKRVNAALTKRQVVTLVSIFFFDALLIGFESYLFKDYFENLHLSEMDFLVNMWGVTFLFLSCLMLVRSVYTRTVPSMAVHKSYVFGSLFSKSLDYGYSFFFLRALTVASASQVTSMKVFYPIVLLGIVFGTQRKLGVDLEEYLDRKSLIPKILGIAIICFGAYLAR
jgi:hypothetical protein